MFLLCRHTGILREQVLQEGENKKGVSVVVTYDSNDKTRLVKSDQLGMKICVVHN